MTLPPMNFQREVAIVLASGAFNLNAQGLARFTVNAGAGCTATVSRVDSFAANAHTTGAGRRQHDTSRGRGSQAGRRHSEEGARCSVEGCAASDAEAGG